MISAFKILPIAAIYFLLSACSTAKETKSVNNNIENNQVAKDNLETGFISGTVTEIQPGKDGYTAKLKTATGEIFLGTISRANLTDPITYRTVKVGEIISIKGDLWQMENQNHITVRVLK
jgi:hypothetical protein